MPLLPPQKQERGREDVESSFSTLTEKNCESKEKIRRGSGVNLQSSTSLLPQAAACQIDYLYCIGMEL